MEYDSIYENLKNFLAKTGGKFSILEDQINVDLQVEFFELANKIFKSRKVKITFHPRSILLFSAI